MVCFRDGLAGEQVAEVEEFIRSRRSGAFHRLEATSQDGIRLLVFLAFDELKVLLRHDRDAASRKRGAPGESEESSRFASPVLLGAHGLQGTRQIS